MRVVCTGNNPGLSKDFVKNYLKIDPDITIEDDVVEAAIAAALEETTELLMYVTLMNTYDLIMPKYETGDIDLSTVKPVQRLIDVKVKEWDSNNALTDVSTLTIDDDYTYEIGQDQELTMELTEVGETKIGKYQYLVINVYAGEYPTVDDMPADTKKAMLKMVADMVESRVDVNNVKSGDWRASDRQIFLRRRWRF